MSAWPFYMPEATKCISLSLSGCHVASMCPCLCSLSRILLVALTQAKCAYCRRRHPGQPAGSAECASGVWPAIATVGCSLHGCWPAFGACIRFIFILCMSCQLKHCPTSEHGYALASPHTMCATESVLSVLHATLAIPGRISGVGLPS